MKTTVELAPDLLERVKRRAAAEGTTFRAVLEKALWQLLKTPQKKKNQQMPDGRVGGEGYQEGVDPSNVEQMRSFMYENNRG